MAKTDNYNLIVDDTSIEELNGEIATIIEELDLIIEGYLASMCRVLEGGIAEGKVHQNLVTFATVAGGLENQLSSLLETFQKNNNSFINDMDSADDFLF